MDRGVLGLCSAFWRETTGAGHRYVVLIFGMVEGCTVVKRRRKRGQRRLYMCMNTGNSEGATVRASIERSVVDFSSQISDFHVVKTGLAMLGRTVSSSGCGL
jgi:hypothetical protein